LGREASDIYGMVPPWVTLVPVGVAPFLCKLLCKSVTPPCRECYPATRPLEPCQIYLALLKERCARDGLGTRDEALARQLRLHLHRGISYLATPHLIRSLADLVRLAVEGPEGATGQGCAKDRAGPVTARAGSRRRLPPDNPARWYNPHEGPWGQKGRHVRPAPFTASNRATVKGSTA
jgi:hypothetical protein